MADVVIALPHQDFDPTEAAVPWRALSEAGHTVTFATADGAPGACDPEMLRGVLLGQVKALPRHADDYQRMTETASFQNPVRFVDVTPDRFVMLVLPGGHAPGMRPYLENRDLQQAVVRFFRADAPVGAICHGLVVLARSVDDKTGQPVIAGRSLTGLPKRFEVGAWLATKMTRGDYFRTYPEWVQDEVKRALGPDGSYAAGPLLPLQGKGFVVEDGALITARWPGDAERWAQSLVENLAQRGR